MIVLHGSDRPADWLQFTADGRRLACSRQFREHDPEGIEFWDVATAARAEGMPRTPPALGFVLHPGGRWV